MAFAKKDRNTSASVYAMIALALFIAGFIFYMVADNQKYFAAKYSLYMVLPNAEGLLPGAFITLAGLKVGVVGEIEYVTHDGESGLRVELKIDEEYQNRITTSSTATVKTMGILGDKYVDITLGELNDPQLTSGDVIETDPGVSTDEVFADAAETITRLKSILTDLEVLTRSAKKGEGIVGKLFVDKSSEKSFAKVITNLDQTTSKIAEGQGTLGKLVQDTTMYVHLSKSSENLHALLDSLHHGQGTFARLLSDSTFYPRVKAISVKTDSLLYRLQNKGTTARLLRERELYDNWVNLARSLDSLSTDLKKNPGRYVKFGLF